MSLGDRLALAGLIVACLGIAVVYLWPAAGGVNFDFKFRPRFGLKAQSAPSLIYDYYNPDARAVVAPVLFAIK